VRLHIIFHASHERLSPATCVSELILKYIDQRTITGQKNSGYTRLAVGARDRQVIDEMGMHEAKPDERLSSSWYAGEQNETSSARASGIGDYCRDSIRCSISRRGRSLDAPKRPPEKQLSCCSDERRKRAIGIIRQKSARIDDLAATVDVVFAYDLVEHVGTTYSNPAHSPAISAGSGWDEHRCNFATIAFGVITPKVSCVRVGLVDVCVRGP
jgi:hypothetical protein